MTDPEIVEAFLRSTIENPDPDPCDTLQELMTGKEPDDNTQSVAFAIYASARTAIHAMLRIDKSLRTIDHRTMEVTESESMPDDIENVLRTGAMVLALARDEGKYSPIYYVGALLDLVTISDEEVAEEGVARANRNVRETIYKFTRLAVDNVRKGRHVVAAN